MPFKKTSKPQFSGVSVIDPPQDIAFNTVYVVGERKHKWVAILKCPCGCNETIQLNLLKEGEVCWTVRIHNIGTVTVRPSIWRVVGCKSHFTIKNGYLNWIRDWEYF